MNVEEHAQRFADAFNSGDYDTVASYLADNYQFSGATPEPVGKEEWLGLTYILKAAFPDIQYNLRIDSVEGNVVKSVAQLTGTHTGDLDMSPMGGQVVPPTGISFANPEERPENVWEGDKVVSTHVPLVEGGGLMGILAQLGIEPPPM